MTYGQQRSSGGRVAHGSTLDLGSPNTNYKFPKKQISSSLCSKPTLTALRVSATQDNGVGIAANAHKRLEHNEILEQTIKESHRRRRLGHFCSAITTSQFKAATKGNTVTALYEKKWGTKASPLNFICGINGQAMYCSSGRLLSGHSSRIIGKKCVSISQSLMPHGMPFKIEDSSSFGAVICTPFYCLIVSLIPNFPSSLYSMQDLSLSRIISNYVFRHELSFNECILIEPASAVKNAHRMKQWGSLVIEIKELMSSSGAYPPMPLLCQSLTGLGALMRSVLPATLGAKVRFYTNYERFTEGGVDEKYQSMLELISFLLETLDACVIPLRSSLVQEIRENFNNCLEGSDLAQHLVNGLETTVRLLGWTKLDQLNARLRDRVSTLRFTSESLEIEYVESQIRAGRVSILDFVQWLKPQPLITDLFNGTSDSAFRGPTLSARDFEPQSKILLNKLVAGFLWTYLRLDSRKEPDVIFQSDRRRIISLQVRFDRCVMNSLYGNLNSLVSDGFLKFTMSIRNGNVRDSPVYRLIEARELATIARSLDRHIVQRLETDQKANVAELMTDSSVFLRPVSELDSIVAEIGILLSLHWVGARRIYMDAMCLIIR